MMRVSKPMLCPGHLPFGRAFVRRRIAAAWITAAAALFFLTMTHGVQAQPLTRIDNPASLTAALTTAKPGTVFDLAGGEYGPLTLTGLKGTTAAPITLRSADPAHPARFSRMQLRGVSHVTLQGLTFDYRFDPGDKSHLRPFQITSAQGITLTGNLFDGDTARGVSAEDDGFPTAFGLSLRQTSQVRLDGNVIRNFYRGLVVSDSTDLTVRHNDVHDIRADGMDFAQVDRVLIEGNHIHDFRRVVASADHADMIQFWTRGTTRPSTDITIRGNILNSGTGMYTQSIFMRNDLVDTGKAGHAMFYRRVVIEQNIVINAHMNGIAVGETDDLTIRNNTVVRNAASQGVADNPARWTPQIRVAPTSTQVTVTANVTSTVTGHDAQTGWTVTDNYLIQDRSPRQSGYYDQVFVAARSGDPTDLASFAYLKGGPLAGKGIGAALLDKPAINLNGAEVPGLRSSDDRAGVSE